MKNLFIAILMAVSLTGCLATISDRTQVANVAVVAKCEPTVKVTPIEDHPIKRRKKNMSLYDKHKLTEAELKIVEAQNKELTAALSECTK